MKISIDNYPQAMSWETYYKLHESFITEHKTSGSNQSEDMLHYTMLNWQRIKRIYHHTTFDDETTAQIMALPHQNWLVITEAWCGDAAQSVPALAALAALNEKINLSIVFRDEQLELMDKFLTNGSRSIPVFIFINPETDELIGQWGPRPAEAQKLLFTMRTAKSKDEDIKLELQKWYNKNKSEDMVKEVLQIISRDKRQLPQIPNA
ncbi:MAG: thioredoxin family protein [Bacteroidia bacterium]